MSYKEGTLPGIVGGIVTVAVIVLVLGVIIAWPVMWLINWLFAPSFLTLVFGVPHIGFWQTWALMVICGVLFKGSSTSSK